MGVSRKCASRPLSFVYGYILHKNHRTILTRGAPVLCMDDVCMCVHMCGCVCVRRKVNVFLVSRTQFTQLRVCCMRPDTHGSRRRFTAELIDPAEIPTTPLARIRDRICGLRVVVLFIKWMIADDIGARRLCETERIKWLRANKAGV